MQKEKGYWPLLSKQPQNPSFSLSENSTQLQKTEETKYFFSFANTTYTKVNIFGPPANSNSLHSAVSTTEDKMCLLCRCVKPVVPCKCNTTFGI